MNSPRLRRWIRVVPPLSLAFVAMGTSASFASGPPTTPPGSEPTASEPIDSGPVDSMPAELPDGYVWLTDDTGFLTVAVPDVWSSVDTAPADLDGIPQPWIAAAPTSWEQFRDTFDESGVLLTALPFDPDPTFLIELYSVTEGCSDFALKPYAVRGLVGATNVGTRCGTSGTGTWQLIVANPADQSFTAMVLVQDANGTDAEAIQIALDTFATTRPLPIEPTSSAPGTGAPIGTIPSPSEPTN